MFPQEYVSLSFTRNRERNEEKSVYFEPQEIVLQLVDDTETADQDHRADRHLLTFSNNLAAQSPKQDKKRRSTKKKPQPNKEGNALETKQMFSTTSSVEAASAEEEGRSKMTDGSVSQGRLQQSARQFAFGRQPHWKSEEKMPEYTDGE